MSHYFWMRESFRGIRGGVNGGVVYWPHPVERGITICERSRRDQESAASLGEDSTSATLPKGMPAFKRPSR
jgi:hypothetical protein